MFWDRRSMRTTSVLPLPGWEFLAELQRLPEDPPVSLQHVVLPRHPPKVNRLMVSRFLPRLALSGVLSPISGASVSSVVTLYYECVSIEI